MKIASILRWQGFHTTPRMHKTCQGLGKLSDMAASMLKVEHRDAASSYLTTKCQCSKYVPSPSLQSSSLPFHTAVPRMVKAASFTHDSWLPGPSEVGQRQALWHCCCVLLPVRMTTWWQLKRHTKELIVRILAGSWLLLKTEELKSFNYHLNLFT